MLEMTMESALADEQRGSQNENVENRTCDWMDKRLLYVLALKKVG